MDWLPLPADFDAALAQARRCASAPERAQRLAALSRHRLDFLQAIQLDRAMSGIGPESDPGLPRCRLALLGSATVEHLVPGLRAAALRRGLWLDVYCGGYGQYQQELIDPRSPVHGFRPQMVLISIAAPHALPEVPLDAGDDRVGQLVESRIEELRMLWRRAREDLGATPIQQTLINTAEPVFGGFDRLVPGSPWSVVERFNRQLERAARADCVSILDLARACQRDGLAAWFDPVRMHQAKQEIGPASAPAYGELAARIVCAHLGLSRKCLVLDLDNTIWGGVLGDDGLHGLVLGPGSAAGEAYVEVQRHARRLRERGVILAICSKNDPRAAEEAFDTHPEMVLRRSDIAAFVANWQDKAANLQAIARQLDIGLDSLVFVDDNPAERARIRGALPPVAVPELPDDVSGYVDRLASAGYFEAVSFTPEDRQRAVQYARRAESARLRESGQSLAEFLRGLEMAVEYGPFAAADLPRIVQLINKTNQFTPTTRRYTAEQVEKLARAPGAICLQFRLRDRLGDNGLVSAMILLPADGASDRAEIDTWVMSCRVFGRELEHEALNIAVETARRAGLREIVATYVPTPRNDPVRELYPKLGFRPVSGAGPRDGAGPADGTTRWSLQIREYTPHATRIARAARHT